MSRNVSGIRHELVFNAPTCFGCGTPSDSECRCSHSHTHSVERKSLLEEIDEADLTANDTNDYSLALASAEVREIRAGRRSPTTNALGGDDPLDVPTLNDFVADMTAEQDAKYRRNKAKLDRSIAETDEDILEEENKRRLGLFDDPPEEGDPLALTTENERYGAGFTKGDRVQFASPSGKKWVGSIVWIDHDTRIADIRVDGKETVYAGVQIAKLKPAPGSLSPEQRHDLTMGEPEDERDFENHRRLVGNRFVPGDDPLPIPEL